MKRFRSAPAFILMLACFTSNQSTAQVLPAGSALVDVYYGFPNFSSFLKLAYANSGTETDIRITGLGPMGVRGEYLLTDRFGLGLEVNYSKTGIAFKDTSSGTTYDYEVSVTRVRAFPRFNIHFLQNSDMADVYGAIGAGYHNARYKLTSTDPNFDNTNVGGLSPVAFRLAIGFRAFFAGVLGAGMEIGLGGGALLTAGLSLRFGYLG